MGAQASKCELSPQAKENFLNEYYAAGGVTEETHTAGWSSVEIDWLLTAFNHRCYEMEELRNGGNAPTKGKKQKKESLVPTLQTMVLRKDEAFKYIIVFNQSFGNYPSLSDRFWRLINQKGDDKGVCSFLDYTTFMYKVVRGSWEDRTSIAFNLFDTHRTGTINRDLVIQTVTEISEFMCNVARGVLNIQEFNQLKINKVDELFKGTTGTMNQNQFTVAAVHHQTLLGCCEILDMVFGRVVRKMEQQLKKDLVFGRHLQETALGNAKDITGEMPFVPEVVASAIHYLRKYNALGTPELFRVSVSTSLLTGVKKELNNGLTLKTYFQRYQEPQSSEFMLLASLIKFYCSSLKEPAFTTKISRKIIIVEESCIQDDKKLEYYKKIFLTLPTPNRYFLGTLIPFLKEVADAQVARNEGGCMTSANLGIVFAPSTLYNPDDPSFGITSSTKAFAKLIDNANSFNPGYSEKQEEVAEDAKQTFKALKRQWTVASKVGTLNSQ